MNTIRQQLLKSASIRPAGVVSDANAVIEKAKRPLIAVRGNDVQQARTRKALAILSSACVS